MEYFYSSVDRGTLYHVRNLLHQSNVQDFNACEDFIDTVTSRFIVAAALTTFDLKSTTDTKDDVCLCACTHTRVISIPMP